MLSDWRYIVQRARTGEFLDMDLPMTREGITWPLSGVGSLRGSLAPEIGGVVAHDGLPLLDEWGTFIYAEAAGQIRWGGIVVSSSYSGGAWAVEAASFATYPHGIPYLGDYSKIEVNPDTVVRHLWSSLQAAPGGDLGVRVTGNGSDTPVRLGTPEVPAQPAKDGKEATEKEEAEPYVLQWWEAPDVGSEIDSLCDEARLEFRETHRWASRDSSEIIHEIEYAYPRLGRRRTDLHFVTGENIIEEVQAERSGDEYANSVLGIGAGEGELAVRETVPGSDDSRLRRVSVYTDKAVSSRSRLRKASRRELARLSRTLTIPSITVRDHMNARIGSWDVGDDILVEADIPWAGHVSIWCRITEWSLDDEVTATLNLARSDSFIYGA